MSGRAERIELTSHGVCLHPERWERVEGKVDGNTAALERIERKLEHHNVKLFEGNGREAIIPSFDKRLSKLEEAVVPRDDVMQMVNAFRVGRGIILGIATVAAIGFLGTLFWHLFQRVRQ